MYIYKKIYTYRPDWWLHGNKEGRKKGAIKGSGGRFWVDMLDILNSHELIEMYLSPNINFKTLNMVAYCMSIIPQLSCKICQC